MKIGIYGGCFNPPHKMHEKIAKDLIKNNHFEKVIFVPTGDNYPKKGLESAKNRFKMLKMMCEENEKLEVSDYEIRNHQYTYQTLQYFQEKYPKDKIYFVIGSDNLKEIKTWQNYQIILKKFYLIVIQRNQDDLEVLKKEFQEYQTHIDFIKIENTEIASSKIRKKILEEGIKKELRKYMDEKIIDYIKNHQMYVK